MKIVGVLSAYDESPSWLAAAAAGFARVCDAIVYCDGAYVLYPGARPRSHPDQAEAVMLTCESLDVECLIHRPSEVYGGNEVGKRNQSLRLAGSLEPDWLLVFDADYHVIRCEPDRVRAELEATDRNVATYTLLDGMDLLAQPGIAAMAEQLDADTEWTFRTRDIYRWTPDLRYGPAHWTISGTYNGEQQWIRGPELTLAPGKRAEPAHHLNEALAAVHRSQHRAKVRKGAAADYYRLRDLMGVESTEQALA